MPSASGAPLIKSSSDQKPSWYDDWAATQRRLSAETDARLDKTFQEPEETTQPGAGTPDDGKHYPRLQYIRGEQLPCYVCARKVEGRLQRQQADSIPCCLMCAMDLGYEILNCLDDMLGGTPLRLQPVP